MMRIKREILSYVNKNTNKLIQTRNSISYTRRIVLQNIPYINQNTEKYKKKFNQQFRCILSSDLEILENTNERDRRFNRYI